MRELLTVTIVGVLSLTSLSVVGCAVLHTPKAKEVEKEVLHEVIDEVIDDWTVETPQTQEAISAVQK